jgi:Zn-dependent oligopeptidase
MWVHNDGFLQRIAQLSQDQFTFQPELMNALRDDLKKQKALELMETVFLSNLELTIFTDFDPRGDETLVSLQQRLAEEYIPHNVPFDSDLSPLVEIFRGKAIDPSMKAYGPLWSEILAAMAYEKFSSTDLTNDDEVKRLGRGIRNLFLSEETSGKEAIEMLCEKKFSSDELKNVYDF